MLDFMSACPPPYSSFLLLPPASSSFFCRTSTASSRSPCSPPDPNSNLWIKVILAGPQLQALDAVFPAGPQQQPLDQSVPRRTSTTSSGSERSPPDLHRKLRIRVLPAGPQPQRISEDIPDRMPERMSEGMPDTYARKNVTRYGIYRVSFFLKKECETDDPSLAAVRFNHLRQ